MRRIHLKHGKNEEGSGGGRNTSENTVSLPDLLVNR